jgi:molybdopterin-guanine dinucleotide biosynthesis protein A
MHGVLLCGGKSSRMGVPKQWLILDGQPILVHLSREVGRICEQVVVVTHEPKDLERLRELGQQAVPDRFPGQGPLAGLEAGLRQFRADDVVCLVGCDLPFLRAEVLKDLEELLKSHPMVDAVVPQDGDQIYPVSAVYRGQVREVVASCLQEGRNRMRSFLEEIRVLYVPVERWRHVEPFPFFNMNTPADYERVQLLWKKG